MNDLVNYMLSFLLNLVVAVVLVRFIYYPTTHKKAYVFTFIAFNTLIFFVLSFMTTFDIGVGVGFGLFAIFSILRYRTDPVPIREMTYLFIITALPVMNSASLSGDLWPQLIAANVAIVAILFFLEKEWGFHYETSKPILYEKIALITPDRREELIADLEERTGLKIKRVAVSKIDFMHDTANLKVYYDDLEQEGWASGAESISSMILNKDDLGD